MIRKVIPLVALVLSGSAMAQVGIGTKKPVSSAQLEVFSSKKGVLLPRVELVSLDSYAPIEGDYEESLLIYHVGNSNIKAGFYYWKDFKWTALISGDVVTDRKNNTFRIGPNPTRGNEESLIVTDTQNHSVYLAVADIANNSTFIKNLTENSEFITKLGDNVEFIENIINKLRGVYGNVSYKSTTNKFYYFDEHGVEQEIDWSALNTTNVSFTLEQDFLIVRDSDQNEVKLAVAEIANNSTFIKNLTENSEFITKLGDNVEFIENIINKLKGVYGNVNYNSVTKKFYYFDEHGVEQEIDWSALNTTNVSFTLEQDFLIVRDSDQNEVKLAVAEIANNSTFIKNLTENSEFITKLGDNVEFIENIINKLKGKYGNVGYDTVNNNFFYYDENYNPVVISWDLLGNTKIKTFEVNQTELVITDTEDNRFAVPIDELGKIIANNDVFVTELTENSEFITKLGDNVEFIENIINKLKGKYGNVGYDTVNNNFFYYDENYNPVVISWDLLGNTKIKTFEVNQTELVITDTEDNRFAVSIDELGKIIANNDVFVTELTNNSEFITKLGDNNEFKEIIKNNSAEAALTLTDSTVNTGGVKGGFTFNNGKTTDLVKYAETLTELAKGKDADQMIEYSYIDETGAAANTKITVTKDIINDFELILNDNRVKQLLEQFISVASGDISITRNPAGDLIIKTATAEFNLSQEIRAKQSITTLVNLGQGVYEYKNEDIIVNGGVGVKINVVEDVQNNFEEIIDNSEVKNILNEFLTKNISNVTVTDAPNGDIILTVKEPNKPAREINLTQLVQNESFVASIDLKDGTTNANSVLAGFEFKDGKNAGSKVFAETLTKLNKGQDANQMIEYSYMDETGAAANTKITVTKDIINDFELILNDNTVKQLLEQFISTTSGEVSVTRNPAGDLIIKTATAEYNLSQEIRNKQSVTTLTSLGEGVYEYKNENVIVNGGDGVKIDVVKDVQNNFQKIVDDSSVTNILNTFIKNNVVVNYSYDEQIKPEKWLDTADKIALRMFNITLNTKTNVIEVPGDFASVILNARLIHTATNSITEGVIRKEVVGGNTRIILGTAGSFTVAHPTGTYYLILEYVKK
ncbi:hypothetical protein [Myroides sp. WP-1]|uniref:hypothetical protein n=1 Tax=Myroides sp. WP-1 TaxID=2759944 RepID=UPI0015FDFB68|nr:hypothetical protein [Myroides sp. WP-1]MBB1139659.1 hypothetical protein [Myroides sp. WP-1]